MPIISPFTIHRNPTQYVPYDAQVGKKIQTSFCFFCTVVFSLYCYILLSLLLISRFVGRSAQGTPFFLRVFFSFPSLSLYVLLIFHSQLVLLQKYVFHRDGLNRGRIVPRRNTLVPLVSINLCNNNNNTHKTVCCPVCWLNLLVDLPCLCVC